MKRIVSIFVGLFITLLFTASTSAGGLYLKTIGSLNVDGTSYPHYWYTGSNPVLTGGASPNASLTITVNGQVAGTPVADETGSWSQAIVINEGDNTITVTTETVSPYTFTLTKGAVPEGVGGITTPEMPAAGVGGPTIILASIALLLLATPIFFRKFYI
jgi:hypothetical protein